MCYVETPRVNNLFSSMHNIEEHVTYSKSNNIEIIINDEGDEVIEKRLEYLRYRYQNNLESI